MKSKTPFTFLFFVTGFVVAFPILSKAEIDTNNNELSDIWEAAFPPSLLPGADDDFDGYTNLEESRAGTDPRNAMQYPRSPEIEPMPDNVLMHRWASQLGIRYQPWASGDLQEWVPVGLPVLGTGEEMELTLNLDTAFSGGGIQLQRWDDLTDWGIYNLKNVINRDPDDLDYDAPEYTAQMTRLEIPQSEPDAEYFGHYGRGWLVPPVSGLYTFWISGDDGCEFWLSSDASPEGTTRVATVPGWTYAQEWTKYPEQQSSPISLQAGQSYYFEFYHFEGGGGDHLAIGWTQPGEALTEIEIIEGTALSSTGERISDFANANGHLFFRYEVGHNDSDNDGLTDYEEGILGTDPFDETTTPRVADMEIAQNAISSPSTVSIGVAEGRAYEADGSPARLRIFRTGGIGPVEVPVSFSGSAEPGDFSASQSILQIPAGSREVTLEIMPESDSETEPAETVTITLGPGGGYEVGSPSLATISIDDARDILYIAALRSSHPELSGGAGYAIMRQTGNGLSSLLSLSFQGLSSSETGAEIFLSSTGTGGPTVFTFPQNQVQDTLWNLVGENGMTPQQLVDAAATGQLWVRVLSDTNSSGEIIGQLRPNLAWQTMPPVPETPSAQTVSTDQSELARFLTQATFGPNPASLSAISGQTYAAWIDQQIALPPSLHHPRFQEWQLEYQARNGNDGYQAPRRLAWWDLAILGEDQLRQRMAFALSQIFVISQIGNLEGAHEGVTTYYDILVENAFGNYRDLLNAVTRSPMMGAYLSMLRNRKPDAITGHEPDENYAREIMQLFSIGLMQMHPDGTLQLDAEGEPIPTYTQEDIVELAHIFTGWGPHYDPLDPPRWSNGDVANLNSWFLYGRDELRPMTLYPEYHDDIDRSFLDSGLISGGLSGEARLQAALDTIFNHQNVGPFMAKQLIQKFVTSNPSPGYVYRVAQVFDDNGAGVRGDLGATLKAVLLDYEARNPEVRSSITYGKPLEPVLRMSRMLRALPLSYPLENASGPHLGIDLRYQMPEQSPLDAPSVFNFFQPGYAAPGAIAAAGIQSPEFQIFAETTAISQANNHFSTLTWGIWTFIREDYIDSEGETRQRNVPLRIDYTSFLEILNRADATVLEAQADLIDYFDTYWLYGTMSAELRGAIETALAGLPHWFNYSDDRQRDRIHMAAYIVLTSPEFFVQR